MLEPLWFSIVPWQQWLRSDAYGSHRSRAAVSRADSAGSLPGLGQPGHHVPGNCPLEESQPWAGLWAGRAGSRDTAGEENHIAPVLAGGWSLFLEPGNSHGKVFPSQQCERNKKMPSTDLKMCENQEEEQSQEEKYLLLVMLR